MLKSLNQTFTKFLNEQHLGEIIRGGATTFLLRFIGFGLGLLLVLFISRVYGAKVLGEYSLAISILTISALITRLGFDGSIVKLFAQRVKINDWGGIKSIYVSSLSIITISGGILSLILFFGAEIISTYLFKKPGIAIHIKIISILIIPLSLRLINAECYRGFKNMIGFAYSKDISYYLYALIILIIITLVNKQDLNPIIAFAAGLFFLGISSTLIMLKKINSHKLDKVNSSYPTKRELLTLSLPMLLSSASLILAGHLTKLLLGVYVSEDQLGIFNATLNVVMVQSFVLAATNSIAGPKFAEAHHLNNTKDMQSIARYASNINVYLTIPLAIILLIFNKSILGIFGNEFVSGSTAFIIMLIGNAISIISGPVAIFMNMTGLQNDLRNIMSACLIISFLIALYLIPNWGIIGGALSYTIFVILWNITGSLLVKIKTGVTLFYWPYSLSSKNEE